MHYLHARILEAQAAGVPISPSTISEEILFRERSHAIDPTSAFSSLVHPTEGIAPLHADSLPPLVTSIQEGTIASFPLRYNHADAYIGSGPGSRTVLVGDAAHTVHPLAGQGLNMGLADVASLTHCIERAVLTGGDIGSRTALLPYARERYLANHTLMSAIDKLHRIYGTDAGPVVWARSVGLEVVNELDTLKAAFMLSAGAKPRVKSTGSSPLWSAVADGIQGASDIVTTAKMVGGVTQGLVGASLEGLRKRFAKQ